MSKKLTDFFISNKENISLSKMQESVASIWACDDIQNFFHHFTHFYFRRQNLIKKIDLVKNHGFINFHGSNIIQSMAKFQAMLQQNQPTKGVSWKNWRVLRQEKVIGQLEKGPVL